MTAPRPPTAASLRRLGVLFRCVLGLVSAAHLLACNRDPCGGLHVPTNDPNAPHIVDLQVASIDVINPWQMNFALSFTDANGDLGGGLLDLYVGASEPLSMSLLPYFHTSEVDPTATAGRLGIDLNFAQGGVQDDNVLRVGFQLRDSLRNYSNCYTLDVHFDVDLLGQARPLRARQVPCQSRLAMRWVP